MHITKFSQQRTHRYTYYTLHSFIKSGVFDHVMTKLSGSDFLLMLHVNSVRKREKREGGGGGGGGGGERERERERIKTDD